MQPGDQQMDYNDASPVISLTVGEFKTLIAQAMRPGEELEVELANRWEGGEMVLRPGKAELQERAIPIETFFHKIVMLRDRLRVLEQKLNSHPKLADEDKVEMQQYITRVYGTLTTFNLLFRHEDEQFRGEGRLR